MEYTTLGNTGLRVSVAGLGCGGFSRIGLSSGKTEEESANLVRQALDYGINFIDTAAGYGTEPVVGKAIKGRDRDSVVISTKTPVKDPEQVVDSLDLSLQNLGIDCIDVFHIHGVAPSDYAFAREHLVPALQKEQKKGKFKYLGITEVPPNDPNHESLIQAIQEDCFRVIMVAHHMLHQSAERDIFPVTQQKGIGVLIMFAVRVLFSEKGRLQRIVQELVAEGRLSTELKDIAEPLDFLIHKNGAHNIIDAAYRYCRHTKGSDVVLFGTGNPNHIKPNIDSILSPPLPEADVAKLRSLFGTLTGVGLDRPGKA